MADPAPGTTIFGVSKSTISGLLTGLIGTLSVVTAFQAPSALMTPQATHLWLYISTGATLLVSVLKVWVGLIQGDAPTPVSPPPTTTDALGKTEPSTGGSK